MPSKQVDIAGIGPVTIVRSARNKRLRLSVSAKGVRVSMPLWTPYSTGVAFAHQNSSWIARHSVPSAPPLHDGARIGRFHSIDLQPTPAIDKVTSRVTPSKVVVRYPSSLIPEDEEVQTAALRAAERALKREATQVLPKQLANLAASHGFHYSSVQIKRLQRRWGSCDAHHHIILNYYLMELPWECIEYVLLHELTHTEHLNHSEAFWKRMKVVCPRVADIRRQMRQYHPGLQARNIPS